MYYIPWSQKRAPLGLQRCRCLAGDLWYMYILWYMYMYLQLDQNKISTVEWNSEHLFLINLAQIWTVWETSGSLFWTMINNNGCTLVSRWVKSINTPEHKIWKEVKGVQLRIYSPWYLEYLLSFSVKLPSFIKTMSKWTEKNCMCIEFYCA